MKDASEGPRQEIMESCRQARLSFYQLRMIPKLGVDDKTLKDILGTSIRMKNHLLETLEDTSIKWNDEETKEISEIFMELTSIIRDLKNHIDSRIISDKKGAPANCGCKDGKIFWFFPYTKTCKKHNILKSLIGSAGK